MTLPFPQYPLNLGAAETEIRAWLKSNRHILVDYDATEVAHLAVLCGFNIDDVCKTLSTFQDAMNDTNIDNRMAMQSWLLDSAIARTSKLRRNLETPELNLMPQWKKLADYQNGIEETL